MKENRGQASPSTASAPHLDAARTALRATVAFLELAPEVPIGRRGSRQTLEAVSQLYERDLPRLVDAIAALGGTPVSLIHTQLIALLPPDTETVQRAKSRFEELAATLQGPPLAALATGPVHRRRLSTADTAVTLLAGPTFETARRALAERLSGGAPATRADTVVAVDGEAGTAPDDTAHVQAGSADHTVATFTGEGSQTDIALCVVSIAMDDRAPRSISRIMELAVEMDGVVVSANAHGNAHGQEIRIITRFERPPSHTQSALTVSEVRAGDFALLLREKFDDQVRCALAAGTAFQEAIPIGDSILNAVAGEPVVTAMDLLEYAQPGQIALNGAGADRMSGEYAMQPIGGVNRGGKRIPAGTTLLLWREYPVTKHEAFLGRESELQEIQAYLRSDAAETLHLTGRPGIGKSALVEQIVRSRPASSVLIVIGSDNPAGPFAAVTDAVREYWDLPSQGTPAYAEYLSERLDSTRRQIWEDEYLAEYDRLRHFMEHALGVENDLATALDPETRYASIHDALAALLRSLQSIRILWVDDLQWIDESSAKVIETWVGDGDTRRLRVLTTVRTPPQETHQADAEEVTGFGRSNRELRISGLAEPTARELLAQRGTPALIPDRDVNAIIRHCAGNPFFLDQCVRFVAEEIETGSAPVIPESVHAAILARIERLSDDVREAVEMAAVLGLRFDMRILSAMLREEKLPNALGAAQREGFWEAVSELNFIFCHALIRDAVYDAQFEERRVELHTAAIRAFEQVYSGDARRAHLYQLADHCERAGWNELAIDYLAEAAEYAFEQYENDRAVALLRRRLALAGSKDLGAIADLANALHRTAAWEEALQLLETTVGDGPVGGAHEHLRRFADCCYELAHLHMERGDPGRAREIVEIGLDALEGTDYGRGRALLYRNLGLIHFRAEEYERAIAEYTTALDHARASGERRIIARMASDVAVVQAKIGRYDEALAAFESTLRLARELNDIRGISTALNNIGYLYDQMGEFAMSLPYFEEDLARCVEAGLRQDEAIARGNIASILSSLGRHEEATTYYRESIDIDTQIGFLPHKAYNLQQLGSSLIALGDTAGGCRELREAARLAHEIDFPMVRDNVAELLESCSDDGEHAPTT